MKVCPISNSPAFQGKICVFSYEQGKLVINRAFNTTPKQDELIKRTVLSSTEGLGYTRMWKNPKTDRIHELIENVTGLKIKNKDTEKNIYVDYTDKHIVYEDRTVLTMQDGMQVSISFPQT